jgi:hypothetical protein
MLQRCYSLEVRGGDYIVTEETFSERESSFLGNRKTFLGVTILTNSIFTNREFFGSS